MHAVLTDSFVALCVARAKAKANVCLAMASLRLLLTLVRRRMQTFTSARAKVVVNAIGKATHQQGQAMAEQHILETKKDN